MYRKENFIVTVPSKEYLKKSHMINKLGFVCKNLDDDYTDYWTSSPSFISNGKTYGFRVTENGNFNYSDIHTSYGVRPIIMAKNLKDIISNEPLHIFKKGFPMIEFGKWYKPTPICINDLKKADIHGIKYCFNNNMVGLEIDYNSGLYAIAIDKIYSVVPINWYYDEENDLLLSEKTLFESPLTSNEVSDYNDFESTNLYEMLNSEFLTSILKSASRDEIEKENEESLIEQITMLMEENEKLKSEIKTLNEKSLKTDSPEKVLKFIK